MQVRKLDRTGRQTVATGTKKVDVGKGIGVDLGTANILIYLEGVGIVFNEPSVIAYEYETQEVIAVGRDAAKMIGRGHHGIRIVSPLNEGVVSDMDATKDMIEYALRKVDSISINPKLSTILICCPSVVTPLERDALLELGGRLGVKDIFIEDEVKAGAIGAGIDIYQSNGVMVVDIGGGSTDVGVLSLGDIVVSESIRIAGNHMDNLILNYIQYAHRLLIGKKTAETIKIEIGTLREEITEERVCTACGRDVITGLPKRIELTQTEIRDVLIEPFETITNTILKVLQETPAELSSDIMKNGVIINGGGALVDGIEEFLHKRIDLDFRISKHPLTAIVEGSKVLLKNRGSYFVKPIE